MIRTSTQNRQLHSLLTKAGLDLEDKETLVHQFTGKRTTRSSEMTRNECQALINELKVLTNQDLLDRKRKRVIAHLAEAGFITEDGRPDMVIIHAWVKRQKHKKELNSLNSYQLSELIHAAEKVKDHFISKTQPHEKV